MAKFLGGYELNSELEKVFEEARDKIILISPYIKLHERYISALLTKINNPEIEITILFGKNEDDISKSMKQENFNFFKQFPNIEILYEKKLHAKYYSNEKIAILTSMNLYKFSQNNNIEAGILMKSSFKGSFTGDNDIDSKSAEYFYNVLEQAELLFEKRPIFEKKNFLSSLKYTNSEIEIDRLSDFFSNKQYSKVYKKKNINRKSKKEIKEKTKVTKKGYCIRTGVEIRFNIEKPLSSEAYKMWNKYKDVNYPEKYCHFSGEKSNKETSLSKPILKKYWKKAKGIHNF